MRDESIEESKTRLKRYKGDDIKEVIFLAREHTGGWGGWIVKKRGSCILGGRGGHEK